MKNLVSIVGLLSLVACGQAHNDSQVESAKAHALRANMYSCAVEGDINLGYTTTSIFGQPTFTLSQTFSETTLPLVNAAGRDSIKVKGNKVSVVRAIPDHSTTTWTLAIPAGLTVDPAKGETKFQSTLTEVTVPTSIVGPLPGQVTTTKVLKADCEAGFAAF